MCNSKTLISTSDTPLIYYKECMDKGIKRCSSCLKIKTLDLFSFNIDSGYHSSHCRVCGAYKRKLYRLRELKDNPEQFITKKNEDKRKGIKNLRLDYVRDQLVIGFKTNLKRKGMEINYTDIGDAVTSELIEAKLNLIKLTRKLKTL